MKVFVTIGFTLLIALLLTAQFYNQKLEAIFKNEMKALVRGELQYSNFSTSFFKNFPDVSVKFSHVILLNDTSKIDTLVKLESIQANFSFTSLFTGKLGVRKLKFNNAEIFLDYLEKWQIFRKQWKPSMINLEHSEISFPFSSWIYYRKKQKISFFPDIPNFSFSEKISSSSFCTNVLIRKAKNKDQENKECISFNLEKGVISFMNPNGLFQQEGLKSIHFYEQ